MYITTNGIRITKGSTQQLVDLFETQDGIKRQPGFINLEIWAQIHDTTDDFCLIVTHWESETYYDDWINSEAFKESHSGSHPTYILGPGQTTHYQLGLTVAL